MTNPLWQTALHDQMEAEIVAILRGAGFTRLDAPFDRPGYLTFAMYETTIDPRKDDLSDWEVRYPVWTSLFAEGKVQFITAREDDWLESEVYINPTWRDVLIEAERSCRARGAPALDHVYLESVEPSGPRRKGLQQYELFFGS